MHVIAVSMGECKFCWVPLWRVTFWILWWRIRFGGPTFLNLLLPWNLKTTQSNRRVWFGLWFQISLNIWGKDTLTKYYIFLLSKFLVWEEVSQEYILNFNINDFIFYLFLNQFLFIFKPTFYTVEFSILEKNCIDYEFESQY